LAQAIQAGPANGLNQIGDHYGRPIKRPTLTKLIQMAAVKADLPDHCVPHGLRKALLRRLAEDGATSKQIAAISGHRSLKEIERYTDAADQKTLAQSAMNKLRDRTK
jgi:integrase